MITVEVPEGRVKPLTPEYLNRIFIQSYRFSQGTGNLQFQIFQYLRLIHPDWEVDQKLAEQSKEMAEKAINRLLLPPTPRKILGLEKIINRLLSNFRFNFLYKPSVPSYHAIVSQSDVKSSINREWGTMITCLSDKTSQARLEEVISGITAGIIDRDHYYLMPKLQILW
jgi:hypothetical protein